MRHIFIINPRAGKRGRGRLLEQRVKALDAPREIIYTREAGEARRIARTMAETGEQVRLYACGGDGTLNEVVNGAAGFDNAAVTNVPVGTANDFLKIFGRDYRERFMDIAALAAGPQAAMDLIDCNGLLGIGIVCTGLDSRIAAEKDAYAAIPLVNGIGAYLLSMLVNVCKGMTRPTAVECGNLRYVGETTAICVCSGRYYGGGFMPVGDNMPDDGLLETLIVPKVSRATFVRLVGKYGTGRYRDYPDLIWYRQGNGVTVHSAEELVAVVDGEAVRGRDLEIRLSDKKVNFFYPADADYGPRPPR